MRDTLALALIRAELCRTYDAKKPPATPARPRKADHAAAWHDFLRKTLRRDPPAEKGPRAERARRSAAVE